MILLVALVIGSGKFTQTFGRSYSEEDLAFWEFPPDKVNQLVQSIDPYTATIEEAEAGLDYIVALAQTDEVLEKPPTSESVVTAPSRLEVKYTVQKGDSIVGIARKFNLHVATIAQTNNFSVDQLEKLSPGQTLVIPAEDTSDSTEWLAELNRRKEQARQLALKKQQQTAQKKRQLASARTVIYRERAGGGYDGEIGGDLIVPIASKGISRGLGRGHTGIDYRADIGTPVYATLPGRVVEITGGWGSGWGISVLLDHGGGRTSRYAHLSQAAIGLGDVVSQGSLVGYSGNTGNSSGPHLHFEVRLDGRPVNPF